MRLPNDIHMLIIWYLIYPIYQIGNFDGLSQKYYPLKHLCKNPRALGWIKKKILDPVLSGSEFNDLILGLCANPNPKSIKIIEMLDISNLYNDDIIKLLFKRPDASKLILKLFNNSTDFFQKYSEEISGEPGGEELLRINPAKTKIELFPHKLAANTSSMALKKFAKINTEYDDSIYYSLCLNPNPLALKIFRNSPMGKKIFDFANCCLTALGGFGHQQTIEKILAGLSKNPCSEALYMLSVFIKETPGPMIWENISGIASNPSDKAIDFIEENIEKLKEQKNFMENLLENPNPEALDIYTQLTNQEQSHTKCIGTSTVKILRDNIIKDPLNWNFVVRDKQLVADNDCIYENPGLFVINHNSTKKLVNKLKQFAL